MAFSIAQCIPDSHIPLQSIGLSGNPSGGISGQSQVNWTRSHVRANLISKIINLSLPAVSELGKDRLPAQSRVSR
jgi:hypothetical protein